MSGPDETKDVERLQRELDELKRRNEELEHQIAAPLPSSRPPHRRHHPHRPRGRARADLDHGALVAEPGDRHRQVRAHGAAVGVGSRDPELRGRSRHRTGCSKKSTCRPRSKRRCPNVPRSCPGALTSGLQTVVREATLRVVESDQFAELWTSANRLAHEQMVAVLTGKSSNVDQHQGRGREPRPQRHRQ